MSETISSPTKEELDDLAYRAICLCAKAFLLIRAQGWEATKDTALRQTALQTHLADLCHNLPMLASGAIFANEATLSDKYHTALLDDVERTLRALEDRRVDMVEKGGGRFEVNIREPDESRVEA